MLTVKPTGEILGATIEGADLAKPLSRQDFGTVLKALGEHGVLRFPKQKIDSGQLRSFSEQFGEIQLSVGNAAKPGELFPEVGILSNVKENGQYVGAHDAGQDWHTDMSYRDVIGFVNVLYGLEIPREDGRPLGGTEFSNMHRAYEDLPTKLKTDLKDVTVRHDFNKFWEHMRRDHGSTRPPLTPEQRAKRPPAMHPLFLTHPITGRKVLYANPGYAERINELSEAESDEMLEFLFAHQLQEKYRHTHRWEENDLLIWDHIGTIHRAIADYRPDQRRYMKRCQVMATRVFDPAFLSLAA